MKFLFILFLLFVLFVFIFGFSILRMLFKGIFGIPPSKSSNSSSQNQRRKANSSTKQTQTKATQKIITRDEGEYVDFEEVKD
jgi:hypothetical protein